MKLSEAIDITGTSRAVSCGDGGNGPESSDPDITGIHYRSDRMAPGGIFVALPGQSADGHDFVDDAVSRGAVAVVVQRPVAANVCTIKVDNPRKALGALASAFYGNPSRKLTLIGVTGTNGKTTTAYLMEHILRVQGLKTGVIGTINYHYAGKTIKSGLTTPESVDLQHLLANMADAGVSHAVIEVSSHGVALDRIFGCRFHTGVFTNLSQDHLDFHKDMDDYWAAKKRFFHQYLAAGAAPDGPAAVINMNDEKGRALADELSGIRIIRVGADSGSMVYADRTRFDAGGVYGRMHLGADAFDFHCPLVGRFNLENVLCAAGGAMALGVPREAIKAGIETFVSVPGRLEPVPNTWDRHVFVDFSHTPDALENALQTLREIVSGRLICVFGCGGDRDRGKRPKMGEIAARHADLVVVTSDNPRTEAPEQIIADILAGITEKAQVSPDAIPSDFNGGLCTVEPDRRKAIRLGIRASKAGDAVLIAGKGHETYQIIGKTTIAFDDRVEAEQVLSWGMNDVTDTMDS